MAIRMKGTFVSPAVDGRAMYPARVRIVVEDLTPVSAVFSDAFGLETSHFASGKGEDLLERLLTHLGFRMLITQCDGKKTDEKILGATGNEMILSIRNHIEGNEPGEREWSCVAHVLVDGVDSGYFSFDTTSPLYHDFEKMDGILQSIGIEVDMDFGSSAHAP